MCADAKTKFLPPQTSAPTPTFVVGEPVRTSPSREATSEISQTRSVWFGEIPTKSFRPERTAEFMDHSRDDAFPRPFGTN